MTNPVAPIIIRGEVIDTDLIEYPGRGNVMAFEVPDSRKFVDRLPLASPGDLADLYQLSFDDILDYLEELGNRLDINTNKHMQRSRDLTYDATPLPREIIDMGYEGFSSFFERDKVWQIAEKSVGLDYLKGWVEHKLIDGVILKVRAFGSRTLHIVARNGPGLGLITLLRCAISHSDCIIKAPSNDPHTSAALALTMIDMAPNHPITKHFSVAYWKGGDAKVEDRLYQPTTSKKSSPGVAWPASAMSPNTSSPGSSSFPWTPRPAPT